MESRPKLTLAKPLSQEKLVKIKLKRTSQEIEKAKAIDRKHKIQRIKTALKWLCSHYPVCFNRLDPKPLKLKIEQDIYQDLGLTSNTQGQLQEQQQARPQEQQKEDQQADTISNPSDIPSKKSIRDAIGYYARNIRYHRAILTTQYRVNLQGQEIHDDPIVQHQRDHAIKIIALVEGKKKKGKSTKDTAMNLD